MEHKHDNGLGSPKLGRIKTQTDPDEQKQSLKSSCSYLFPELTSSSCSKRPFPPFCLFARSSCRTLSLSFRFSLRERRIFFVLGTVRANQTTKNKDNRFIELDEKGRAESQTF